MLTFSALHPLNSATEPCSFTVEPGLLQCVNCIPQEALKLFNMLLAGGNGRIVPCPLADEGPRCLIFVQQKAEE